MEAICCPASLSEPMAPVGRTDGPHRELLQNQASIAQNLGKKNVSDWSNLAMQKRAGTRLNTITSTNYSWSRNHSTEQSATTGCCPNLCWFGNCCFGRWSSHHGLLFIQRKVSQGLGSQIATFRLIWTEMWKAIKKASYTRKYTALHKKKTNR